MVKKWKNLSVYGIIEPNGKNIAFITTSLMQIFAANWQQICCQIGQNSRDFGANGSKIWWCAKTGQNRREFAASSFAWVRYA